MKWEAKINPVGADLEVPTWTWGYPHMQIDRDIEIHVNVSTCIHVGIWVYVPSCVCVPSSGQRGPRSSDSPMAVSTPSTQILVSWDHSPLTRTRTSFRKGERRAWNFLLWQKVKKVLKRMTGTWQKDIGTWFEGTYWPNLGQLNQWLQWNLNIKKNANNNILLPTD